MAHAPFGDDLGEYDEDGMDDPVVLRGLLQAVVLTLYFAVRYLLDVVFTPRAVQAASHKVLNVVFFCLACVVGHAHRITRRPPAMEFGRLRDAGAMGPAWVRRTWDLGHAHGQ